MATVTATDDGSHPAASAPSAQDTARDRSEGSEAGSGRSAEPLARPDNDSAAASADSGSDREPATGGASARERALDRAASAAARAQVRARAAGQTAGARGLAARERAKAIGAVTRARAGGSSGDAPDGAGENSPRDAEATVSAASVGRVSLLPGRRDILINHRALVRGYVPTRRAGTTVVLEVLRADGSWAEVDRVRTIDGGKFYLEWYPRTPGHYRVRARPVSSASGDPSPTRLLYIYRTVLASWYGPGFYGNRTACGQTFTSRLLGVANRTLPCGKRVTIRYGDRAITVPVVDRGPYVAGRDYDLTEATKNYLGFEGVDRVWATA